MPLISRTKDLDSTRIYSLCYRIDMSTDNFEGFRQKLEANHLWPSLYMFKFIVPSDMEKDVTLLFPKNKVTLKSSKTGKYVSLTAEVMIGSTDQIIEIYKKAHNIEGLIAL